MVLNLRMISSPGDAGAARPSTKLSNATEAYGLPDVLAGGNVCVTLAITMLSPVVFCQMRSKRTSTVLRMPSPSPTRCQDPAGMGPLSRYAAWLDPPSPMGTPQNGLGGPSGMS